MVPYSIDKNLFLKKNALAIKRAMDKGIYVTIATGRMPASASYFAKQLNMNCPVVSCNGGVVKDLNTGKSIYEAHFSKDTITELISICYQKIGIFVGILAIQFMFAM